jgi:hypothetical protein
MKRPRLDFLLMVVAVGIIAGGAAIWFNRQRVMAEKLIGSNRSTPAETPRLIQEWKDNKIARADSERKHQQYLDEQKRPMPRVVFPSKPYKGPPTRVEVIPSDRGELLLISPEQGPKDIRVRLTVDSARTLINDLTRELKEIEASKAKP